MRPMHGYWRKCDGYPTATLTRRSTPDLALPGPKGLSLNLFGSPLEGECFQFFTERTAIDFCGYFDSRFWTSYLPRVSFSEPAIRHALIALGAVHRKYELGVDTWHPNFALAQYTKAVSGLRQILVRNVSNSVEMSIISSILFAAVETFQGNYALAMDHLKGGLRIMSRHKLTLAQDLSQARTDLTEEALEQLLIRLEVQAQTFFDADTDLISPTREDLIDSALPTIPLEFESLEQARDSLWQQARCCIVKSQMNNHQPADAERHAQVECLLEWSDRFSKYMKKHERGMSIKQFRAAILLKMYRETCYIILMSEFWQNDEAVAALGDHFARVVALSESLVDNPGSKTFDHPVFTLEMGVLPPLYVTACRCPDSVIRYQAISLLQRTNRREGMWDGRGAYSVAEKVSAIEEDAVVQSGLTGSVKVRNVDCTVFLEDRKLLMRYCQTNDQDGTTVWKQEWVTW